MLQPHRAASPERGKGRGRDEACPVSATEQAQPVGCPQQGLGHGLIVAQRKEQAAPLLHRSRLSHCSCIPRTISATEAQTAAAQVSVGRDSTGVTQQTNNLHRQPHWQVGSQQQLAA